MRKTGTGLDLSKRIAREHAILGKVLRDIEMELAHLGTTPGRPPGNLIRLLASFDKHLEKHFEFEEEGGPLGDVGRNPTTERWGRAIIQDHRDLESRLKSVLARLADPIPPTTQQVLDDVRAFLHDLREHEAQENALFQELLYRDTGGGD